MSDPSQQEVWNLRTLGLFGDLTPEELRGLSSLSTMNHYRRGEFLFHTGETADRLYFLHEGTVQVSSISPEGDERILGVFGPGDIFGQLFSGRDGRWIATAQAATDVTAQSMTEETFVGFVRTRPDLFLRFARYLVDQHRRSLTRLEALMHPDPGVRLLAVLVDLGERLDGSAGDTLVVPASPSQEDLARMTGLHRCTVSLLINSYRRKGVLGGRRNRLLVHRTPAMAFLKKAGLMLL